MIIAAHLQRLILVSARRITTKWTKKKHATAIQSSNDGCSVKPPIIEEEHHQSDALDELQRVNIEL